MNKNDQLEPGDIVVFDNLSEYDAAFVEALVIFVVLRKHDAIYVMKNLYHLGTPGTMCWYDTKNKNSHKHFHKVI